MGLIDRIIRRASRSTVTMMGGGMAGDFRQEAYKNAVVRETVDAIARHAAKLSAVHMRSGQRAEDGMQYIIGTRPNPLMSAYDLQYKLIAQTLEKNNGFVLPVWQRDGLLKWLLPVDYTSCTVLEDQGGSGLYVQFALTNGKQTILPYVDLIHLRRHFARSLVLGDDNRPLDRAVEMVNTADAGMMSAVRAGSNLRGILKIKQAQLKDKDVRARRDDFVNDYIENGKGGLAALDASMDYQQLDPSKMYSLTTEQMAAVRANVYRYFGVNEKFVSGAFGEADWDAIYESVIEPIGVQLHMEYTNALFTDRERAMGESVEFEANRLQYASTKTKTDLVNRLGMLGLLTYNEAREVFNLPKVADGDRLIPPWNSKDGALLSEQPRGTE